MTKQLITVTAWSDSPSKPTDIRIGDGMKPGEVWIVQATEAGYGILLSRLSPETRVSSWCRLRFAWLALWPKSKALVRM
jgi:hypothetical protein